MRDTSRVCGVRGLLELVGASLCLLAFVSVFIFVKVPPFVPLTGSLFGFITLTVDGFFSLMKSRKIAKFR